MQITVFNEGKLRSATPEELGQLLASDIATIWVDILVPTDEDVRIMRDVFQFHPLAIEDTRNHKQRPKIEEYPGYLFLIINSMVIIESGAATKGPVKRDLEFDEIDIFVGRNYVVTVHNPGEPAIAETQRRLDLIGSSHHLTPGYLVYTILDVVVDNYFPVMDMLEEEIDVLEDTALNKPDRAVLNRVFELKHMMLHMWRVVWPLRDVLGNLLQPHHLGAGDKEATQFYLRDVSDHLLWIADMIATYRDTLTTIIDLYMSAVSNRLNQVVNRLSVFTLVIGVLTVISGFYGMNFTHNWPPFEAEWAVPFTLALMIIAVTALLVILRRKGWF